MELVGLSSASISVDVELRRDLTQNLRGNSVATAGAKAPGGPLSRVEILDVQISVTIDEVRGVLLAQVDHRGRGDTHAAGETPDAVEARMPKFWRPEAVADRALSFVGSAAGGDAERLRGLVRAVEKAFAEAEGILPDVSRRTMHLVRQGLGEMLQELKVPQAGPAGDEAVELSATARELAAQPD